MASRKDSVRPYTRTEQVQTTLTLGEREQLDARAAAEVVSRADLIRRLIVDGLKVGEIVGTIEMPEIVPEEYARQLAELRAIQRRVSQR